VVNSPSPNMSELSNSDEILTDNLNKIVMISVDHKPLVLKPKISRSWTKICQFSTKFSFLNWSDYCKFPKIPKVMLELTSLVISIPIESG